MEEVDLRKIESRLDRHSNRLQQLEAFQLKESTELTQLKSEIKVMDGTTKAIQQEVSELKTDVNDLSNGIEDLKKKSDTQYKKLVVLVVILMAAVLWKDASSLQKILAAIQAIKSLGI